MEKTEREGKGRLLPYWGRLSWKVRDWWTYQRIQQQIFFSMLLVSLLGTALLGSISYRISSRALEETYRLSHEYALKNSSKVLDMKLSPVIEMIRSFLYDRICSMYWRIRRRMAGSLLPERSRSF